MRMARGRIVRAAIETGSLGLVKQMVNMLCPETKDLNGNMGEPELNNVLQEFDEPIQRQLVSCQDV